MARSKYWQYLINEEGQPVPYATIQLFNASTTTPASAYAKEESESIISGGILTTDSAGYFDFWVDGNVYTEGMKFDLLWSKPGSIVSGGLYDVYVPINYEQVDEADTDTYKNKLVSNSLAKGWENKPKIYTETSVSAGYFQSVSAGAIKPGFDYYYDLNHDLLQDYPVTAVYVLNGKAIDHIPEYISGDILRIWMQTADVSGTGEFNFTIIG